MRLVDFKTSSSKPKKNQLYIWFFQPLKFEKTWNRKQHLGISWINHQNGRQQASLFILHSIGINYRERSQKQKLIYSNEQPNTSTTNNKITTKF
jgi:hypothetical protein